MEQNATKTPLATKHQLQTLAKCGAAFAVSGSIALSLGSLMPHLREAYDFSYVFSGTLLSVHSLGNLLTSFLAGFVSFKIGRKRTAMTTAMMGICFYLLLIVCGGLPALLLLAFFLSGCSRGGCTNINNTVISVVLPGKSWAMNTLHALFAVGAFLCPFLVLFLSSLGEHGWMLAAAVLGVCCFVQLLLFRATDMPPVVKKGNAGAKDLGFMKNPRFLIVSAIMFFYMCVEQGINGWLVTYFQDSGLLSADFAQTMASVLWLFVLAGRLSCAVLSGKFKSERLLCFIACGYVVCFIALLSSHSIVPIAVFTMGVGFCMAGIYPTTLSTIGDICEQYPLAMSVLLTIVGMGAIIMPTIIGFVAERYGIILGMCTLLVVVSINTGLIFWNAALTKKREAAK